jgi:hypothetical protein
MKRTPKVHPGEEVKRGLLVHHIGCVPFGNAEPSISSEPLKNQGFLLFAQTAIVNDATEPLDSKYLPETFRTPPTLERL